MGGGSWRHQTATIGMVVSGVSIPPGQEPLDPYLQHFLGSPPKTHKRKLKDMYCLHFNFQVYKKYFIILIQEEIKHLSFLNERSPCPG